MRGRQSVVGQIYCFKGRNWDLLLRDEIFLEELPLELVPKYLLFSSVWLASRCL